MLTLLLLLITVVSIGLAVISKVYLTHPIISAVIVSIYILVHILLAIFEYTGVSRRQ